jgi:DNA polymerase-3 subunit delta'
MDFSKHHPSTHGHQDWSTNWGMVGHHWAVEHLALAVAHDRFRQAYLIAGPASVGKLALARNFARALNCTAPTGRPCGKCRACHLIATDAHADVSIIRPEGSTFKIDQIREMVARIALRPVEARTRVVILDDFNKAQGPAQDALLKTLEEPPTDAVLLLITDRMESMLPTIRSRCQPIVLRPVPAGEIRAELEQRGLEAEQAALLAQLSEGRLGWALKAAAEPRILENRNQALLVMEQLIGADSASRFQFAEQAAQAMQKDKDALLELCSYWFGYWRDVLLLVTGARHPIANRDHRHALEQLAASLHTDQVHGVLKALERTRRYLLENSHARLTLEVLMLDLPHVTLLAAPPGQ